VSSSKETEVTPQLQGGGSHELVIRLKAVLCTGAVIAVALGAAILIMPRSAYAYECGVDEHDYALNSYLPGYDENYLVLADINKSYWYVGDAVWVGRRRDSGNNITFSHLGEPGDSYTYGTSGNVTRKTTLLAEANSFNWDVWEGAIC